MSDSPIFDSMWKRLLIERHARKALADQERIESTEPGRLEQTKALARNSRVLANILRNLVANRD